MISGAGQATGFAAVLNTARRLGRTDDPLVRQELAKVHTNELILKWMGWRTQTAVMTGRKELALHGSLLKNFFTRSLAHRVDLAVDLEGAEGMLWHDAEGDGFWQYQCLNQFASRHRGWHRGGAPQQPGRAGARAAARADDRSRRALEPERARVTTTDDRGGRR